MVLRKTEALGTQILELCRRVLLGFTIARYSFECDYSLSLVIISGMLLQRSGGARKKTTVAVTDCLLIIGFAQFIAGAIGTIQLGVLGAKPVTSLPGPTKICLGYRL
jgi:hypothetical protein